MRAAKCRDADYIDFLIATPRAATCTEAAAVQPDRPRTPAHDAFTRLLHRLEPDPAALWAEVEPAVRKSGGVLVVDDSTLDKPSADKIALVSRHWSGQHKRVVWGIHLVTLLWTDGDRQFPCDYRIYHKEADGLTKNDHLRARLGAARDRGFAPECVTFDSWYSGLDNLKLVRSFGWRWLTQLKANRRVNPDRGGLVAVSEAAIAAGGSVVWLEGYGPVKVFKVVSRDGDIEYGATGDVARDELELLRLTERCWAIETYHRALKPCGHVERAQVRAARAQRNHIGLAIRAYVRLEHHFYATGVSWYEAKARIIRGAVRAYIAQPVYGLPLIA